MHTSHAQSEVFQKSCIFVPQILHVTLWRKILVANGQFLYILFASYSFVVSGKRDVLLLLVRFRRAGFTRTNSCEESETAISFRSPLFARQAECALLALRYFLCRLRKPIRGGLGPGAWGLGPGAWSLGPGPLTKLILFTLDIADANNAGSSHVDFQVGIVRILDHVSAL